jgi:hypothetical protein
VIIPKWLIVYTVAIYCANFVVTGQMALEEPPTLTCEGPVSCTVAGFDLLQLVIQFISLGALFSLFDPIWASLLLLPLVIGWGAVIFQALIDLIGVIA